MAITLNDIIRRQKFLNQFTGQTTPMGDIASQVSSLSGGISPEITKSALPSFEIIPKVQTYKAPEPEATAGDVLSGLAQGFGRVPFELGGMATGLAGTLTGSEDLMVMGEEVQKAGRDIFPGTVKNPNQTFVNMVSKAASGNPIDLINYAANESPQVLASSLATMVPGFAGAKAVELGAKLAGYSKAKNLAAIAELAGTITGGIAIEAQGIAQEAYQNTGKMPDLGKVIAHSAIPGIMEAATPFSVLQGSGKTFLRRATGHGLSEAGTEATQTVLEKIAAENLRGTPVDVSIGKVLSDPQTYDEAAKAGIVGFAGGAPLSTISGEKETEQEKLANPPSVVPPAIRKLAAPVVQNVVQPESQEIQPAGQENFYPPVVIPQKQPLPIDKVVLLPEPPEPQLPKSPTIAMLQRVKDALLMKQIEQEQIDAAAQDEQIKIQIAQEEQARKSKEAVARMVAAAKQAKRNKTLPIPVGQSVERPIFDELTGLPVSVQSGVPANQNMQLVPQTQMVVNNPGGQVATSTRSQMIERIKSIQRQRNLPKVSPIIETTATRSIPENSKQTQEFEIQKIAGASETGSTSQYQKKNNQVEQPENLKISNRSTIPQIGFDIKSQEKQNQSEAISEENKIIEKKKELAPAVVRNFSEQGIPDISPKYVDKLLDVILKKQFNDTVYRSNKNSKKVFEKITGHALPASDKATQEWLNKWNGEFKNVEENKERLASPVRRGETVVERQPEPGRGGKAAETGGNVQENKKGEIAIFKTSKGSSYSWDGKSTTRTKSYHPEHGKEDVGVKQKSSSTIFVKDEASAHDIRNAIVQKPSGMGSASIFTKDGEAQVFLNDEKKNEWSPVPWSKTKFYSEPEVGLYPIEIWKRSNGTIKAHHIGNKIVSVEKTETKNIVKEEPAQKKEVKENAVNEGNIAEAQRKPTAEQTGGGSKTGGDVLGTLASGVSKEAEGRKPVQPGNEPAGKNDESGNRIRPLPGTGGEKETELGGSVSTPQKRMDVSGTGEKRRRSSIPSVDVTPKKDPQKIEIAEESIPEPKNDVGNYSYSPEDLEFISERITPKARFNANYDAILLLKKLTSENRLANPEEQRVLARYSGWGPLPQVFYNAYQSESIYEAMDREAKGEQPTSWQKSVSDEIKFQEARTTQPEQFAKEREMLIRSLTKAEYEAARKSTINAHYTSPNVIEGIWNGLKKIGFNRGNILEPAIATGLFYSLAPKEIMSKSNVAGVELDQVTGSIAKHLFPNANIYVQGFEKTKLPSNRFDLIVSNVPFANISIFDKGKPYNAFNLHDYYFGKALDLVRPGGIIAFITSKGTMDKKLTDIRRFLSEDYTNKKGESRPGANLLTAIRLPSTAFKGIANTEVVTDLIILQKRTELGQDIKGDWIETGTIKDPDGGEDIVINKYFVDHPENLLGTMNRKGSMYGGQEVSMDPKEGMDLGKEIEKIIGALPEDTFTQKTNAKDQSAKPMNEKLAEGSFIPPLAFGVSGGNIVQNVDGVLKPIDVPENHVQAVKDYVSLNESLGRILIAMSDKNLSDEDIKPFQKDLKEKYDTFVRLHGTITGNKAENSLSQDPYFSRVRALENVTYEIKGYTKTKEPIMQSKVSGLSDIFTKRTIKPSSIVSEIKTPADAIAKVLAETGSLDIEAVAKMVGRPAKDVAKELLASGVIFENPVTFDYETSDQYLSGDVRAKLQQAKDAYEHDSKYKKNVSELEKVIPKDIPNDQIKADLGSPWIDPETIKKFLVSLLKDARVEKMTVDYSPVLAQWMFSDVPDIVNIDDWGVADTGYDGWKMILSALNLQSPDITIKYADGTKNKVDSTKANAVAVEKQKQLREKFRSWLVENTEEHNHVGKQYNDRFNNYVVRSYDGKALEFPGMNKTILSSGDLNQHQKNAVWQILFGGNTGLGHVVGAGKTFTMIAAAMEMKRLGLKSKPAFVVPNHLVEQWGTDFTKLYPGARILVPSKDDFGAKNRRTLVAKIATGNWDAIILPYSQFELISVRPETESAFIRDSIKEIEEALRAEKGLEEIENPMPLYGRRRKKNKEGREKTIKELEKKKVALEQKLNKVLSKEKDVGINFEDTGIDHIFVDEAHSFKNLFYTTRQKNVKGLGNPDGAQRTADLYVKIRHLSKENRGRGVATFATGTPISNSLVEIYTMTKFLAPEILEKMNIGSFDAWSGTFTTPKTSAERTVSGLFKATTRLEFNNIPELIKIFRQNWDIKLKEDVNLPVPKIAEGHPKLIVIEPSQQQKDFNKTLKERDDWIRKNPGPENAKIDNFLKLSSDASQGTLDLRLIDPDAKFDKNSKIGVAAENIIRIYKATSDHKFAQMVFIDKTSPGASRKTGFDTYADLKKRLIDGGIPSNEIAIIHDYNDPKKKQDLFNKINQGTIRVLLGTTKKMGAGTNAQRLLAAVHRLVSPWTPADVEQGDGRILRQGNLVWDKYGRPVEIYNYSVSDSFDSFMWQLLSLKGKMISKVMHGDPNVRTIEDVESDEVKMFKDYMASTSGDPRIKELSDLQDQLVSLSSGQSEHDRKVERAKVDSKMASLSIDYSKNRIEWMKEMKPFAEKVKDLDMPKSENKAMVKIMDSLQETDPKKRQSEFGKKLQAYFDSMSISGPLETPKYKNDVMNIEFNIGNFNVQMERGTWKLSIKFNGSYAVNERFSVNEGSVRRIIAKIQEFNSEYEKYVAYEKESIKTKEGDIKDYEKIIVSKYSKESDLEKVMNRIAKIQYDLNKEAAIESDDVSSAISDEEDIPVENEEEEAEEPEVKKPSRMPTGKRGFIDPLLIPELVAAGISKAVQVGSDLIKSGVSKIGMWMATMVKRLGDAVKPFLVRIWNSVKLGRRGSAPLMPESIMARINRITATKPTGKTVANTAFGIGVAEEKAKAKAEKEKISEKLAETKEELKSAKKLASQESSEMKKNFKANEVDNVTARKQLTAYAKKRLSEKYLGKITYMIASANDPMSYVNVLNKIDSLSRLEHRRDAFASLKGVLSKIKMTGLMPDIRQTMTDILSRLRGPTPDYLSLAKSIKKLVRYYKDSGVSLPKNIDDIVGNELGKMKPSEVRKITAFIASINDISLEEKKKLFSAKETKIKQIANETERFVSSLPSEATEEETGIISKFFNMQLDAEGLVAKLGSEAKKILYDDRKESERKALSIIHEGKDVMEKAFKDIGINPQSDDITKWLNEEMTVSGIKMNRNTYLSLLANLSDSETRKAIVGETIQRKSGPVFVDGAGIRVGPMKSERSVSFSENQAQEAESMATEKEKKLVQAIKKFLNGRLKAELNKTSMSVMGREPAVRDDYFPLIRDMLESDRGKNEAFRAWGKYELEGSGFLKERQKNKNAVVINDFMGTVDNHISRVSKFAGFAENIRDSEMLIGSGTLEKTITRKLGNNFVNVLKQQIEAVKDSGSVSGGELNKGVATLLSRISSAVLAMNPRPWLKQFGGIFTMMSEMDPADVYAGIKSAAGNMESIRQKMWKYSPELRQRYEGSGLELLSPVFTARQGVFEAVPWWSWKAPLRGLQYFDRINASIAWQGTEAKIRKENAGLSESEIMEKTARETERIINRTQNTTSITDMSGIALESRKNIAWKVITAFQSQGNKNFNILTRAYSDYKSGKISASQCAAKMATVAIGNAVWTMAVNMVFQGAMKGIGGDDKEKKRMDPNYVTETTYRLLKENLGSFYGGSNFAVPALDVFKAALNGKPVFTTAQSDTIIGRTLDQSYQGIGDAIKTVRQLYSGEKFKGVPKWRVSAVKSVDEMFRGLLPLTTGIPVFPGNVIGKLLKRGIE